VKRLLDKCRSAAEVRKKPKEKREGNAEEQASDDREVESGVFAPVNDIAGESTEAKGKLSTEVEKPAENDKKAAEKEEGAAEFAKGLHSGILPEGAEKSLPFSRLLLQRIYTLHIRTVYIYRYLLIIIYPSWVVTVQLAANSPG
jgi:hypothetical protein